MDDEYSTKTQVFKSQGFFLVLDSGAMFLLHTVVLALHCCWKGIASGAEQIFEISIIDACIISVDMQSSTGGFLFFNFFAASSTSLAEGRSLLMFRKKIGISKMSGGSFGTGLLSELLK